MSMKYQFIAEFYLDQHSDEPIYKTHLWGVDDGEAFAKEHGFKEVRTSILNDLNT